MPEFSNELYWLTLTAIFTGLMWLPYILWLIGKLGLVPALMDGEHDITYDAAWAARSRRAHANAVENLVIFGVLAIAVHVSGTASALTATAGAVFFFSRLAHYAVYVAGLPVIRTVLFAVGVGCQIVLALSVLGLL